MVPDALLPRCGPDTCPLLEPRTSCGGWSGFAGASVSPADGGWGSPPRRERTYCELWAVLPVPPGALSSREGGWLQKGRDGGDIGQKQPRAGGLAAGVRLAEAAESPVRALHTRPWPLGYVGGHAGDKGRRWWPGRRGRVHALSTVNRAALGPPPFPQCRRPGQPLS